MRLLLALLRENRRMEERETDQERESWKGADLGGRIGAQSRFELLDWTGEPAVTI